MKDLDAGKDWKKKIAELEEIKNPFERLIKFMSHLTQALSLQNIRPVITGGHAVEFYTSGGYVTGDIDLVCGSREAVGNLLEQAGFKKRGRYWHHEDLDLFVEVPGEALTEGEEKHLTCVEFEGQSIYFIGVEDILQDRLNACVHWKSDEDCRWSKELMLIHKDSIDWEYLKERSMEEKTMEAFKRFKKELHLS
jgi:hypothetical protein